jgi:hypothetical protein
VGFGGCDAVECFFVGIFPVVPLRCVHAYRQDGELCYFPIRWSFPLVARSFFGRWAWALVLACLLLPGWLHSRFGVSRPTLLVVVSVLLGLAATIGIVLCVTGSRHRKIRRVLGRITPGNCDPATLPGGALRLVRGDPRAGGESYAEAASRLLQQGEYARAMLAARLCACLEDVAAGEAITAEILDLDEVESAIAQIRRNRSLWEALMLGKRQAFADVGRLVSPDWDALAEMTRPLRPGPPRSRPRNAVKLRPDGVQSADPFRIATEPPPSDSARRNQK